MYWNTQKTRKNKMMKSFCAVALLASIGGEAAAQPGAWEPLFNGKDLTGWQVQCKEVDKHKTYWSVIDGAIVCNSLADGKHDYVWLMSTRQFSDFELKFKVKAYPSKKGNSGLQFRSHYDETFDGGWLDGPQVDIHPPAPFRTGLIYDETRTERRWIAPSRKSWGIQPKDVQHEYTFKYADEGWNEMRIICRGTTVKTYLNGALIVAYDGAGVLDNEGHVKYKTDKRGYLAFQLHRNDALKIHFKDIRIREFKQ